MAHPNHSSQFSRGHLPTLFIKTHSPFTRHQLTSPEECSGFDSWVVENALLKVILEALPPGAPAG
jgi:hypothetical protein